MRLRPEAELTRRIIDPQSLLGQRLVRRGDFHLGAHTNCFVRVSQDVVPAGRGRDVIDSARVQGCIFGE